MKVITMLDDRSPHSPRLSRRPGEGRFVVRVTRSTKLVDT